MTETITNMPLYRAIVLENGLALYVRSNRKVIPNRSWTPTRMLRAVEQITGEKFKRGQQDLARKAIRRWIDVQRLKGQTLQDEIPFTGVER